MPSGLQLLEASVAPGTPGAHGFLAQVFAIPFGELPLAPFEMLEEALEEHAGQIPIERRLKRRAHGIGMPEDQLGSDDLDARATEAARMVAILEILARHRRTHSCSIQSFVR